MHLYENLNRLLVIKKSEFLHMKIVEEKRQQRRVYLESRELVSLHHHTLGFNTLKSWDASSRCLRIGREVTGTGDFCPVWDSSVIYLCIRVPVGLVKTFSRLYCCLRLFLTDPTSPFPFVDVSLGLKAFPAYCCSIFSPQPINLLLLNSFLIFVSWRSQNCIFMMIEV